ncbi:MAG: hypothetical protein AB1608_00065 [Thermoproteota archaeon]
MKIDTIESIFESQDDMRQLLEQRIAKTVAPVVQSLLKDSLSKKDSNQIHLIFESIAAKIPSIKVQHYFRAGRNYFTINHQMGQVGNIFFKTMFDILLKENKDKSYQLSQENSFCIICRI